MFGAAETDAVAAEIVDRQADEVVAFVRAAVNRLELADEEVEVVLGGGVLQSGNAAPARRDRGRVCARSGRGSSCASRLAADRRLRARSGSTGSARAPDAYERAREELDRATGSLGDVAGDATAVAELP